MIRISKRYNTASLSLSLSDIEHELIAKFPNIPIDITILYNAVSPQGRMLDIVIDTDYFILIDFESIQEEDSVIGITRGFFSLLNKLCVSYDLHIFPESITNTIDKSWTNVYKGFALSKIYLLTHKDIFKYIIENCPLIVANIERDNVSSLFSRRDKQILINELISLDEYIKKFI